MSRIALGVKLIRETESTVGLEESACRPSSLESAAVESRADGKCPGGAFLEGKTTPGTNVWLKDVVRDAGSFADGRGIYVAR